MNRTNSTNNGISITIGTDHKVCPDLFYNTLPSPTATLENLSGRRLVMIPKT